jgi:hypothetical protein
MCQNFTVNQSLNKGGLAFGDIVDTFGSEVVEGKGKEKLLPYSFRELLNNLQPIGSSL